MAAPTKLLLVGWDGAEWNLIAPLLDAGKLPHLAKLVEGGVLAKLGSLSPPLSAPLWTTVATGRRPEQHGICGNFEPVNEGAAPISAAGRRGLGLWDIVAAAGRPAIVVDWPASWPAAERPGLVVAGHSSAVPGRCAGDVRELRVQPAELSRDDLRPFVPEVDQLEPGQEPLLAELMHRLAGAAGTQAVATFLLENEPWDFAAVHYEAPGSLSREFIDYMAPRLPQVSEEKSRRYQAVMEQALMLHDQMLSRLLALAGPGCAVLVCSTHGWLTGARRPELAPGEHAANAGRERPQGWAVIRAPGIKADELIFGGTILDLAPMVLAMLKLPVPKDWPGKIWYHAMVQPAPVTNVETHEPGPIGSPEFPSAATDSARELRYLHACYLLAASRVQEAIPLLEQAHRDLAPRIGPALQLINAYVLRQRFADARVLLDDLAGRPEGGLTPRPGLKAKHPPQFDAMRGVIAQGEGRLADAQGHFEAALAGGAQTSEMHTGLGRIHLARQRPHEAKAAFARALEIDSENSGAHYGLAAASYRLRDFTAAADHAMEAASRRTEPPEFHLLLGLALGHLGQREQAVVALRHALARRPNLLVAHRALVALHKRNPAESVLAETHRRLARDIRRQIAARQGAARP